MIMNGNNTLTLKGCVCVCVCVGACRRLVSPDGDIHVIHVCLLMHLLVRDDNSSPNTKMTQCRLHFMPLFGSKSALNHILHPTVLQFSEYNSEFKSSTCF